MKNLKKLLSAILILSLALCMTLTLVSCGGDSGGGGGNTDGGGSGTSDEKSTHTVTVKDTVGNAVSGVKVQLLLNGELPLGDAKTTDADGKAGFSPKNEGKYYVKVTSVPAGYDIPQSSVEFVNNAAAIVLEKLPVYTVYVKDAGGNPIVGAAVQICDASGACQLPKNTDSEGKIESALKSDTYKAKVVSAPAGYVFTEDYFYLENNTVTIVLETK